MRPSSCKAKGRRACQEVQEKLYATFTHLGEGDIIVTPSGVPGVDLHLSPKARESWPFAMECKNVERLNFWEAIAQAEAHAEKLKHLGLKPMVIFKRNRSELYAIVKLEHMIYTYKQLKEMRDE